MSVFITAAGLMAFGGIMYRLHSIPRRNNNVHLNNTPVVVLRGKQAVAFALLSAAFLLPMEIDGLGSLTGLWQSGACVRVLTGSAFGFGLPVFFMLAFGYRLDNGIFVFPRYTLLCLPFLCVASLAAATVFCLDVNGWHGGGEWVNVFAVLGLLTVLTGSFFLPIYLGARRLSTLPRLLISFCAAWAVIGSLHAVKYGYGLIR